MEELKFKLIVNGKVVAAFLHESDREDVLAFWEAEYPDVELKRVDD